MIVGGAVYAFGLLIAGLVREEVYTLKAAFAVATAVVILPVLLVPWRSGALAADEVLSLIHI